MIEKLIKEFNCLKDKVGLVDDHDKPDFMNIVRFLKNKNPFMKDEQIIDNAIDIVKNPPFKGERILNIERGVVKAAERTNRKVDFEYIVKSFPLNDFTSCVKRYPDGYLILINSGLEKVISVFSAICTMSMTAMGCFDKIISSEEKSTVPNFDDTVKMLYDMVSLINKKESYLTDFFNNNVVFNTEFEALFRGRIVDNILFFIVAHEMSHIFEKHFKESDTKHIIINGQRLEYSIVSFFAELDADVIATNLLVEHNIGDSRNDNRYLIELDYTIASITAFFALLDLFEKTKEGRINEYRTHPHPYMRLDQIYHIVDNFEDVSVFDDLQLTPCLFGWYEQVLKVLKLEQFYGDGIMVFSEK